MIRYAPEGGANKELMLRTVGGDELNVAVDTARLCGSQPNRGPPRWVSVLPEGPLGDVVTGVALEAGVDLGGVVRVPDADMGTFTVLPELKTVHYQRRHSAFALHDPETFEWREVLRVPHGRAWLHMTGITPMVSPAAAMSWTKALAAARKAGVPVSMDFNHRKQLGPLDKLWTLMLPHIPDLEVLILSVDQLAELATLDGVGSAIPQDTSRANPEWRRLMAQLRQR